MLMKPPFSCADGANGYCCYLNDKDALCKAKNGWLSLDRKRFATGESKQRDGMSSLQRQPEILKKVIASAEKKEGKSKLPPGLSRWIVSFNLIKNYSHGPSSGNIRQRIYARFSRVTDH
jgi:hypothetical protein